VYETIARKFRPRSFAFLLGQEPIVTTLKNALKSSRLGHAYLFCGSRGTGKTTLARLLAKAVNCHALSPEGEPCNQCTSCREIAGGQSLDVLEIDAASNRGIDDIRQINETIVYAASSGRYKIYIIDEVHMLTKEAFNALLKTLEEPPDNVKFFFATTEPHKIPATILSRCQRFDLHRIGPDLIVQKLAMICQELGVESEKEALKLIAHTAEGGLRDAESLLDQMICYGEGKLSYERVFAALGLIPRATYFRLDEATYKRDLPFAFILAKEVFDSGCELPTFLDGLTHHIRTLLLRKLGEPVEMLLSDDDRAGYAASAELYTADQCLYLLDLLLGWQKEIGRLPFKRVILEAILLQVLQSRYRLPLATLAKRLLEEGDAPKEIPKQAQPAPFIIPTHGKAAAGCSPVEMMKEAAQPVAAPTLEKAPVSKQRHETVMRFAAVELDGVVNLPRT
jgi:DNA polymerase-3 subunit gamma/tau